MLNVTISCYALDKREYFFFLSSPYLGSMRNVVALSGKPYSRFFFLDVIKSCSDIELVKIARTRWHTVMDSQFSMRRIEQNFGLHSTSIEIS